MLSAYWWSFTRTPRALLSEARHNALAWARMARIGGGASNFGDELSALAIEEATGAKPTWAPLARANVVGIGSILDLYLSSSSAALIWGSGLRDPLRSHHSAVPSDRVLAVRGALTRDSLGLSAITPLGDPGLLARSIFAQGLPRRGVLVLPHFSVFGTAAGMSEIAALRAHGMRVVAPSAPVRTVCEEIARADFLITSSLHGLVVADALGTPAALAAFTQAREARHKYSDYSSIFSQDVRWHQLSSLADPTQQRRLHDESAVRTAEISSTIDGVVERLISAAVPLR